MALAILLPLLLVVAVASFSLFRHTFKRLPVEKRLYQKLQNKLKKCGVKPEEGETVNDYCDKAIKHLPDNKEQLILFKKNLERVLYGEGNRGELLKVLRRLVKGLLLGVD